MEKNMNFKLVYFHILKSLLPKTCVYIYTVYSYMVCIHTDILNILLYFFVLVYVYVQHVLHAYPGYRVAGAAWHSSYNNHRKKSLFTARRIEIFLATHAMNFLG